jgi:disulfide bond formation protein DsbB
MIVDKYISTIERALLLGGGTSALLLAGAHAFENFGNLPPCELCLAQRDVHWVALGVAIASAIALLVFKARMVALAGLGLMAAVFGYSAWLAGYHAGVEWKFWPGPPSCSGGGDVLIETPADLLQQLETAPIVSCTDAAWRLFGISMAGYNALISLGLALLLAYLCYQFVRKDRQQAFETTAETA